MKRIPLRSRDGSIKAYAKVDDSDYESLSQYTWHERDGYVGRTSYVGGGKETILMHRQLHGLLPGDNMQVDHKNGNGLDNRRSNLRVGTGALNSQNLKPRRNTSSAYRGVSWDKNSSKWVAYIRLNQKKRHLGSFDDEVEAATVAAAARKRAMKWTNN